MDTGESRLNGLPLHAKDMHNGLRWTLPHGTRNAIQ
jgi:hypothetical protein